MVHGNRKHKEPWQRGRRGSLCGPLDEALAARLLADSILVEEKRFATHGGKAYCAKQHAEGVWHGWLVGWKDVPEPLRRQWIDEDLVRRSDVMRFWDGTEE